MKCPPMKKTTRNKILHPVQWRRFKYAARPRIYPETNEPKEKK